MIAGARLSDGIIQGEEEGGRGEIVPSGNFTKKSQATNLSQTLHKSRTKKGELIAVGPGEGRQHDYQISQSGMGDLLKKKKNKGYTYEPKQNLNTAQTSRVKKKIIAKRRRWREGARGKTKSGARSAAKNDLSRHRGVMAGINARSKNEQGERLKRKSDNRYKRAGANGQVNKKTSSRRVDGKINVESRAWIQASRGIYVGQLKVLLGTPPCTGPCSSSRTVKGEGAQTRSSHPPTMRGRQAWGAAETGAYENSQTTLWP